MKDSNYTTFTTLVLLFTLCMFSCEDLITQTDPCEDKVCLNGGFCEDGTCICLNGYTGSNCQIAPNNPDPCEVNNTGTLCIENRSTSNKAYDVVLNGIRIMTLAVGEQQCKTVAAGLHNLEIKYTNSNDKACSDATPVVLQCGMESLYCTG